jgi:cysteine desulfurase/selenocysteine lyase
MYDIDKIRSDFPILGREVNGKPLVYLDNGASAQKPQVVIDAITQAYSMEYANVHRGLHYLSNLATEKYEAVRGTIARFLGVRMRRRSSSPPARRRGSTWSPMAGPCRGCRRATRSS